MKNVTVENLLDAIVDGFAHALDLAETDSEKFHIVYAIESIYDRIHDLDATFSHYDFIEACGVKKISWSGTASNNIIAE